MRIRDLLLLCLAVTLLLPGRYAAAVTDVNPFGVNVRQAGPTSIFLTFQNLGPGQQTVESIWCAELNPGDLADLNSGQRVFDHPPCVPGSVLGQLPANLNLSQKSGVGASNLTDIMNIPTSVTRRKRQLIEENPADDPRFFYVRRFTNPNEWVVVTCRMAGGGARVPLALLDVRVEFSTESEGYRPITIVPRDGIAPAFGARIRYNGTGRLIGRWEVMIPGDPEPAEFDLLTEASLPVEERPMQRRYTLLERFDLYLPPTGEVFLRGPDPARLPSQSEGLHKILLRVEASEEREGRSDAVTGVAFAGGVAGFPMPVLRYHVGTPEQVASLEEAISAGSLLLMLPQQDAQLSADQFTGFSWVDVPDGEIYRLQVISDQGELLSAVVLPGVSSYAAPPWVQEQVGVPLQWRVSAIDGRGRTVAESQWRSFQVR